MSRLVGSSTSPTRTVASAPPRSSEEPEQAVSVRADTTATAVAARARRAERVPVRVRCGSRCGGGADSWVCGFLPGACRRRSSRRARTRLPALGVSGDGSCTGCNNPSGCIDPSRSDDPSGCSDVTGCNTPCRSPHARIAAASSRGAWFCTACRAVTVTTSASGSRSVNPVCSFGETYPRSPRTSSSGTSRASRSGHASANRPTDAVRPARCGKWCRRTSRPSSPSRVVCRASRRSTARSSPTRASTARSTTSSSEANGVSSSSARAIRSTARCAKSGDMSTSTRPVTRSGAVAASRAARIAPSECPTTTPGGTPSASSAASTCGAVAVAP